jgi:hypothetical protein
VEGFVKTFKAQMTKFVAQGCSVDRALIQFLSVYRTSPHVSTKQSPAEAFYGRTIRTRLHLLNPRNLPPQEMLATKRGFEANDPVYARDYRNASRWIPALVVRKPSSTTYLVKVANGVIWSRHVDQLRPRSLPSNGSSSAAPSILEEEADQHFLMCPNIGQNPDVRPMDGHPETQTTPPEIVPEIRDDDQQDTPAPRAHLSRNCGPPQRLGVTVTH